VSAWHAELRARPTWIPLAGTLGVAASLLPRLGLPSAPARLLHALLLLALTARLARSLFPGSQDPLSRNLAALPLSPTRLAVAKLGAALAILACVPLGHALGELVPPLLHGSAPDLAAIAATLAGDSLLACALFGLACWVSPWPRLGGLLLGCLGLALAVSQTLPLPAWLDPLADGWLPWALAAALGVATTPLRVGVRASRWQPLERALTPPPGPRILGALQTICWGLLLGGLLLTLPLQAPPRSSPHFTDPSLTVRTRHYVFVTRASLEALARPLIRSADASYRRVVGLLGGSREESDRLRVALTTPGEPTGVVLHPRAAARARLRLALDTATQLIEEETGGQGGLLRQGLARYAAWRAADVDPYGSRFQLGVAHANRPLALDELLDPRQLRDTRGEQLTGPAGELLVAAVVRLHGEGVVAQLMVAAREPTPRGTTGWRERLAEQGLSLEQAFEEALEILEVELPADPRAALRLPRLRVLEDMSDQPGLRFVAVPEGPLPPGWTVEARVSTRRGRPLAATSAGRLPGGSHAFSSPVELGRPRLQVGLRPPGLEPFQETLWEEWVERR
jgi:hypothetical protein